MTKLATLGLAFNALSGTLPESLMALPLLQTLDLKFNFLNGTLPLLLLWNRTKPYILSVAANLFSGTLPDNGQGSHLTRSSCMRSTCTARCRAAGRT